MKWTGLNDLREEFLSFFEAKEHQRLPSFSLVPKDDNSLLIINSGMAPMKKFFTGEVTPPARRVTTCQKCVRNTDIENVGITSRHLTYFEMLGNFSFGDYFKEQAIPWAWEFFNKTLDIPEELLYISVYLEDDEAYDIWVKNVGIKESHMVRLGKEDNYWEHGAGPCGPCSEIYFDRGEENGCGKPDCAPGCDCDRFVEIGNIVFSQFESDGKGTYAPLDLPNIDFGMGLERLAMVVQGVDNIFLVDTMQEITNHAVKITGTPYGETRKNDVSLRIITDHIRSIVFMIGDGILPSNEGRGYVLRRMLRRAARHGKLLKVQGVFLTQLADTVIDSNKNAYPELDEKRETIKKIIESEETSFAQKIDQGLERLNAFIENLQSNSLSGDHAFLLNDTYGFPLDLTKEILAERKIAVDESRFFELMLQQRERARNARKAAGEDAWAGENDAAEGIDATYFTGYDEMRSDAKILAIIKAGQRVASAEAGDEVSIVLDRTPFYAEGGGQVGDTGVIESSGGKAEIINTTKSGGGVYMHRAVIADGKLEATTAVKAKIDRKRRESIMRNHTSAHLLQAALREVLGTHVEQAGQLVDDDKMRFDFTHFQALSPAELRRVEEIIDDKILEGLPVDVRVMPIAEAREMGAMALFGEKYGDTVRVVSIGDFSREFCGGTHVDNTAKLGLFKILSESSVAAGVRRIEAVTGRGVLNILDTVIEMRDEMAGMLKMTNAVNMVERVKALIDEMRAKDRMIERLNTQLANKNAGDIFENAKDVNGVRIITANMTGTDINAVKTMADKAKEYNEATVIVLAGGADDKINIVCAVNQSAQDKGLKAGQIVKEVAQLAGGNGGGRPDFAMAGIKDKDKIGGALSAVEEIARGMM